MTSKIDLLTPQKKQAVLFLVLMLAISAGVAAWNLFASHGTLVATGESPFTISIGSVKNAVCERSPCEFKLKPKEYVLRAQKTGYFDIEEKVEIKLWHSTGLDLKFKFKPVIENLGEYKLLPKFAKWETNGAEFGPGFDWSRIDLSKIPNGAKKVIFSKSGQKALVFLGKELYFFNSANENNAYLTPINLPELEVFAFAGDDLLLMLINEDEKQKLILADPEKAQAKTIIAVFENPLQDPVIQTARDRILVVETAAPGKIRAYEISMLQKSKHRLNLPEDSKNLRLISENLIVYENGDSVMLHSLKDGFSAVINAVSANQVLYFEGNKVFAVSDSSNEKSSAAAKISIEELIEMTSQNIENIQARVNLQAALTWYFSEIELEAEGKIKAKDIAEYKHEENEAVKVFPAQPLTDSLYFTKTSADKTDEVLVLRLR